MILIVNSPIKQKLISKSFNAGWFSTCKQPSYSVLWAGRRSTGSVCSGGKPPNSMVQIFSLPIISGYLCRISGYTRLYPELFRHIQILPRCPRSKAARITRKIATHRFIFRHGIQAGSTWMEWKRSKICPPKNNHGETWHLLTFFML